MFTDKQIDRMLGKLLDFEATMEKQLFIKTDVVDMQAFATDGSWQDVPPPNRFAPVKNGQVFEGEGTYCWFRGSYTVPKRFDGQALYIWPRIDGYEGMLFVDGVPFGNFASKIIEGSHGNHYCDMLVGKAAAGSTLDIALEYYANHFIIGTHPYDNAPRGPFKITYGPVDICVRNERVWDFYFDLKVVNEMAACLPDTDFVRAKIVRALKKVHETVYYDPENIDEETYYACIAKASPYLKEVLAHRNGPSAPYAGFVGHSHMDTAWLWHRGETEKKCARTYANQINLMEQYPDYTFVQSSAYHSAIIQRMYPQLFERMKTAIASGKYEPNGGVWVECDCNIPSGEYMVRQFLWGQRYTLQQFGYTSDAFWLPDTFGYSASLPQIMQGSRIKYFLTTKIDWNDTNVFPYDTFNWQGIDGTKVLTHFNRTHVWPSPSSMMTIVNGRQMGIRERAVSDKRLISYGFGDGGGGPEFGMVEMAKRLGDVEGLPKSSHTTVSKFMNQLEQTIVEPSTYAGELYLEIHRGTLTNQHTIKRNNRLAEIALRNAEIFTVKKAVANGAVASDEALRPLTEGLLINQFHDILPGTCVPRAHEEAKKEVAGIIRDANAITSSLLGGDHSAMHMIVSNTLSFDRSDVLYLDVPEGFVVAGGYAQQRINDVYGNSRLAVAGVTIPAMGSVKLALAEGDAQGNNPFVLAGDQLTTPCLAVTLDAKGGISSLVDTAQGRQLRGENGMPLNTFLIAEDIPSLWDNWDIDADLQCKMHPSAVLVKREVVSTGAVECRVRSTYQLTEKSTLDQDMIFYAHCPTVVFQTRIHWQDDHRFLKAAFDTSIFATEARQEIQFGYIKRPTTRSTAEEKAKFEVCNHKYTDLSDTRYGAALLNDCKYGISVEDGSMRLSLHKGGRRPDYHGDKGVHDCAYALHPHAGGFGAGTVIQPAYAFNMPAVATRGGVASDALMRLDADNIIIEAVKPMEDNHRAFLVRLYEAEGAATRAQLNLNIDPIAVCETNLLEEEQDQLPAQRGVSLTFRPFEIKSVKITY